MALNKNTTTNLKRLGVLSTPLILSQAGQVIVLLADNMMIGPLGSEYLAAASFANSLFFIFMIFGIGISVAITPIVAKCDGEDDFDGAQSNFRNGAVLNTVSSVVIMLLALVAGFLMPYMGQESIVLELAQEYYFMLVASLVPMLLFFTYKQFAEGLSNTKIAMQVTIVCNVLNIILNYIFIYGKFGVPAMDLNGAGLATLISRVIMPIVIIYLFKSSSKLSRFSIIPNKESISIKKIKTIAKVGFPIGAQMVIEASLFSLTAIMAGWIGTDEQAAHQVVANLSMLTFMIVNGISQSATIRVGNLLGQRAIPMLKNSVNVHFIVVSTLMVIFGILFVILKDLLPTMFIQDNTVVSIASSLIIIAALYQLFDGLQIVGLGVLRGFSDVTIPMYLSVVAYILIGITSGYLIAFKAGLGIQGLWYGLCIGLMSASLMFAYRVRNFCAKI